MLQAHPDIQLAPQRRYSLNGPICPLVHPQRYALLGYLDSGRVHDRLVMSLVYIKTGSSLICSVPAIKQPLFSYIMQFTGTTVSTF
jgi:hypothetical protein